MENKKDTSSSALESTLRLCIGLQVKVTASSGPASPHDGKSGKVVNYTQSDLAMCGVLLRLDTGNEEIYVEPTEVIADE